MSGSKRQWWVGIVVAGLLALVGLQTTSAQSRGESAESSDQQQSDQEVDKVNLAGMLVRDGHYGRADKVLSGVDPEAEGVDRAMYYTLRGLIALRGKTWERAIDHFDDAIRHGKTDEIIFVHLAQAYYGLKNWERTILSVRNAGEKGEEIPDLYLMKAEAQRRLGRDAEAFQTLQAGREAFPERRTFLRQQVFLYVEMGLYQSAMRAGRTYLKEGDQITADDYIAVAEAFRRAGEHRRAQVLLEEARMHHPEQTEILVHLAHAYIGAGDLVAAGQLMQVAAESDAKYVRETAELYRRAGAYERALYMNSRMSDQRAKFKQRVAILLDQEKFERIAALAGRLSRLGLLEDQKIVYALAYAHFKARNWNEALEWARRVDDRELFESAVQLRKAAKQRSGQAAKQRSEN